MCYRQIISQSYKVTEKNWRIILKRFFFHSVTKNYNKQVEILLKKILIAPLWPGQPWFSVLLTMIISEPICLSRQKGLLRNHMREPLIICLLYKRIILYYNSFVICDKYLTLSDQEMQWKTMASKSLTPGVSKWFLCLPTWRCFVLFHWMYEKHWNCIIRIFYSLIYLFIYLFIYFIYLFGNEGQYKYK